MSAGHLHQRQPAAPTSCCPCGPPVVGPVPPDDWHLLFAAVCDRLQASAGAAAPGDPLSPAVLDAVQALRSLQRLLPPPRVADPGLRAVPGCGKP